MRLDQALVEPRIQSLRDFAAVLDNVDLEEKDAFWQVIKLAIHEYGITPAEIQEEFEMTKGGVSKWVNQRTAPRSKIAGLVVEFIKSRALQIADELEKSVSQRRAQ